MVKEYYRLTNTNRITQNLKKKRSLNQKEIAIGLKYNINKAQLVKMQNYLSYHKIMNLNLHIESNDH